MNRTKGVGGGIGRRHVSLCQRTSATTRIRLYARSRLFHVVVGDTGLRWGVSCSMVRRCFGGSTKKVGINVRNRRCLCRRTIYENP